MASQDILTALRRVPLFSRLTGQQLQWVAEHGRELRFAPGARIAAQGEPADGLSIILEGRTEWTRRVGTQDVPTATLEAGDLFGEVILFLNAPYPTTGRALTEVWLFRLEPATFWELLRLAPVLGRELMEVASQRTQSHEVLSQGQPKPLTPGAMAASLSYELSHPASAAHRSAVRLREALHTVSARAMALGEHGLSPAQRAALLALPREAAERAKSSPRLEPLVRSQREEALGSWLEAHGVADVWELTPALVASGLDVAWLESVATRVGPALLGDVLAWLLATVNGDVLLAEVERGTARVAAVVDAVQAYGFMDRTPVGPVDVHEGLEGALASLSRRLEGGQVTVERELAPDLPRPQGEATALNEVWTQLMLNALEALGERGGRLWLRTWAEPQRVVVEIADDGPGIPRELLPRIFEPFFSTRPQAAGLGLDICRRIVERHQGELRVLCEPNGTRVQVRLPL